MNGMCRLGRAGINGVYGLLVVGGALVCGAPLQAQGGAAAPAAKAAAKPQAAPLQMHSLDPTTQADPFPRANPENFTADAPTVAVVDGYLNVVLGWDANRIWRVEAIEKTIVPGLSKVIAVTAERGAAANKAQNVIFYTLPDGKHLLADSSGPQPFGLAPYAENRALLQARADGPFMGAAGKELELVEFADLQCVRCKEAQATIARLASDFPKARIVYESLPLRDIHPFAYEAATWGACIALDNSKSFFAYAQAVYDAQADLTPEKADDTLTAAVTKAGLSPEKVSACAKTPLAKDAVAASTQLARDLGVDQTPTLMVNGRQLPLVGLQYETLKQIIVHQAQLDGVTGISTAPLLAVPSTGAAHP